MHKGCILIWWMESSGKWGLDLRVPVMQGGQRIQRRPHIIMNTLWQQLHTQILGGTQLYVNFVGHKLKLSYFFLPFKPVSDATEKWSVCLSVCQSLAFITCRCSPSKPAFLLSPHRSFLCKHIPSPLCQCCCGCWAECDKSHSWIFLALFHVLFPYSQHAPRIARTGLACCIWSVRTYCSLWWVSVCVCVYVWITDSSLVTSLYLSLTGC